MKMGRAIESDVKMAVLLKNAPEAESNTVAAGDRPRRGDLRRLCEAGTMPAIMITNQSFSAIVSGNAQQCT